MASANIQKIKEWGLVAAVIIMSIAANLPSVILPWGVDRKYLLVGLVMLVAISLVRYLQFALVLAVVILAIGANLPVELSEELNINPMVMLIGLIAMVVVSFINYRLKLPKGAKPLVKVDNANAARALCNAAVRGRTPMVYTLLSVGMDVNARDSQGNTPLMLAAANGHTETVKLLLTNGADMHTKNRVGHTALAAAVQGGFQQTAAVLQKAGAKAA